MNTTTNINNQQIQRGNKNNYSLFYIEGIITKYISSKSDTIISDPNVVNRFIVNNPNSEILSMGGLQNYICIKNTNQYYFFKPEEDTVVILLELSQILHYKNDQWNVIYTFSTGGGGGFVEEPPFDSNKYGRRNNTWVKLDDISDAPINNTLYVRKNSSWVSNPIQFDAPNDNLVYGRRNNNWIQSVPEAPKDGKQYGRKDGNWEIISIENSGLFVPEAPNDNRYYARRNKTWVEFVVPDLNTPNNGKVYGRSYNQWVLSVNEAPTDGKQYARKDGSWELITFQSGITEAPIDNKYYSRRNGTWAETIYLLEAPVNGQSYFRKDGQWEVFVDKAFEDVSIDNKLYARRNKRWEEVKSSPIDVDAPQDNETYGRKNGAWAKIESGGGGGAGGLVGDHNTASNIQGGKKENGLTTEAYHLNYEEYNKIPYKPRIIFPANNSTNINHVPLVELSHYQHPFEYRMLGLHIILSKNPDFAQENIVYEFNDIYGSNSFQIPLLNSNNQNTLEAATTYYIRARYMDNKKNYSLWSDVCKFETMIELPTQLLKTPIITFPSDGGVNNNINPFFVMTSPQTLLGVANFNKSDWQVATDIDFNTIIYEALDQDNLTFHRSNNLNLVSNGSVDFYVRGRQKTTNATYTPYSIPVKFGLESSQSLYDKHVFGLRRTFNENGTHQIYNIDENGDKINLTKAYFDHHPLYQNTIVDVPFDLYPNVSYKMTYIPPIYEKCNVYNDAHGSQVIDLYFSPNKVDSSWWIDPSFISSPGGFYISPNFCGLKKLYDVLGVPQNTSNNVDVIYPYSEQEIIDLNKVYDYGSRAFSSIDRHIAGYYNDLNFNVLNNNSPIFKMMSVYESRLLKDLIVAEKLSYLFYQEYPLYRNINHLWSYYSGTKTLKNIYMLNNTFGSTCAPPNMSYTNWYIGLYKPEKNITPFLNVSDISLMYNSTELLFLNHDVLDYETNSGIWVDSYGYFSVYDIYTGFNDDLKMESALFFIPKKAKKDLKYKKYPFKYYYSIYSNPTFNSTSSYSQIFHRVDYFDYYDNSSYAHSTMIGLNVKRSYNTLTNGHTARLVKQIF